MDDIMLDGLRVAFSNDRECFSILPLLDGVQRKYVLESPQASEGVVHFSLNYFSTSLTVT